MKCRVTIAVLAAVLVVGCTESPQGPTDALDPNFDGASNCYTPRFHVNIVPTGMWTGEGEVTGELVGSVSVVFDPASVTFAGATLKNSGILYWHIDEGIIPGLGEFETTFENYIVLTDRPGSPAGTSEISSTYRALSGVSKANLTSRGNFEGGLVDSDFQGVICP